MSEFDTDAFLAWLDDREGPIPGTVLDEQWPNFPYEHLHGVTGTIVDGELATYQRDLRRAAKRKRPLD